MFNGPQLRYGTVSWISCFLRKCRNKCLKEKGTYAARDGFVQLSPPDGRFTNWQREKRCKHLILMAGSGSVSEGRLLKNVLAPMRQELDNGGVVIRTCKHQQRREGCESRERSFWRRGSVMSE